MIRKEREERMSSRIPTVIVSGFPGIGKTTAAKLHPMLFRDLESSDYHWVTLMKSLITENYIFKENPQWPGNYIEAIKNLSTSGMYKSVFVSAHELVREKMREAKIRYTLIYPEDTSKMKQLIMKRIIDRGSPDYFIRAMDENYSKYVKSMSEDPGATAKLQLTPDALTKWVEWCAYV